MTDYKYLSRKFIISILLLIVSTLFLYIDIINQFQWQIVLMATAFTYIGGKTLEKVKSNNIEPVVLFRDRLSGVFSREFIIAFVIIIAVTIFAYLHKINGDVWFQIITSVGSIYNIFNSISKTE